MSYSFAFNSVNMSVYGLVIRAHDKPFIQDVKSSQLVDRAFAFDSYRPKTLMALDVWVRAPSHGTLLSYLDSIRHALNLRSDSELKLDFYNDRYWRARFNSMTGLFKGLNAWQGTILFILHDPAAYSNVETESPFTIDDDPELFTETVGGTERVEPVYTLTCDDTLTDTVVVLINITLAESLTWEGDLVPGDILEIDVVNYLVKLNNVEDMASVSGQFPRMAPGDNDFMLEGFSGSLNIVYRERYA